jgi:hypothetical protein
MRIVSMEYEHDLQQFAFDETSHIQPQTLQPILLNALDIIKTYHHWHRASLIVYGN